MSMELYTRFEEAIANGEWFEIIYHGGSRPGSKRKIAPIAVLGDRIRARCYTSNAVKPFLLDKIQIVSTGSDAAAPLWTAEPPPLVAPPVQDTRCVLRLYGEALQEKGWKVELEPHEGGWALHLTSCFKNGKPRKTPTHTLRFDHSSRESWIDAEGSLVFGDLRPRVRQWGFQSKTYSRADVPVSAFLQAAGISP